MGAKKKPQNAPEQPSDEGSSGKLEGAVFLSITKRLRAARKKLTRIEELEDNAAKGKPPHPDQEALLLSKPGIVAVIDELEKLGSVVKEAVKEELQLQKDQLQAEHDTALAAAQEQIAAANALVVEAQEARTAAEAESAAVKETLANLPPPPEPEPPVDVEKERSDAVSDAVARLLQLLYFSQVFDVDSGNWSTGAERTACVSYDFSVPTKGNPLTEDDLIELSRFGKSLVTRPPRKLINHKGMVEQNHLMAIQYLTGKEREDSTPEFNATVRRIEERLQRIVASEYYTILPHVPEAPPAPEPKLEEPAARSAPHHPSHAAPPQAPPANPEGLPAYPADVRPHSIHPLPPMPNMTAAGSSGNAILDDPAIAHSQIRRPGTSPLPPPPAKPVPGQMPPPGHQLHVSQVPAIFQQLLSQPPGSYPGYMPQQRMPVPGYGGAPPSQYGIQDPGVYSFGNISPGDLQQPTGPMEPHPASSMAPPPGSAPTAPPLTPHSDIPFAPMSSHPMPAPHQDTSFLQAIPGPGALPNGAQAGMPAPGAYPPQMAPAEAQQAAPTTLPAPGYGGYNAGYGRGGDRSDRNRPRGRGSRGAGSDGGAGRGPAPEGRGDRDAGRGKADRGGFRGGRGGRGRGRDAARGGGPVGGVQQQYPVQAAANGGGGYV